MTALTQSEVDRWLKIHEGCGWTIQNHFAVATAEGTTTVSIPVPTKRGDLQWFVRDLISALDDCYTHDENLLVLEHWYLGPDEMQQVGWNTCELMRRAFGENRSIESAPAQLFRSDESVTARAFLLQVIVNEWCAFLVPSPMSYMILLKDEYARFYLSDTAAATHVSEKMGSWLTDKQEQG